MKGSIVLVVMLLVLGGFVLGELTQMPVVDSFEDCVAVSGTVMGSYPRQCMYGGQIFVEVPSQEAVFAGGCFWCVESDLEKVSGVVEVISGYASDEDAGEVSYQEVSSGATNYVEAVLVKYDPQKIAYEDLLVAFGKHHDPTDAGGQFVDRGKQYRPVIFVSSGEERATAERSLKELAWAFDEPIVTAVEDLVAFYPAEEYHQNYYLKHPVRYAYYREGSGRDQFLDLVWSGKGLSASQQVVVLGNGTERPFANAYWNHHEEGIYVDVISGEPLFSSLDKYDSGTGWPSFVKPLVPENIVLREDRSLVFLRTEVRSRWSNSHLGHLFEDGPVESGGLRYCMNSVALRFVAKDDLVTDGYGEFVGLFG